jgi:hypothetical protein
MEAPDLGCGCWSSHNVDELGGDASGERVGEQRWALGMEEAGHGLLAEVTPSVLPLVVLVLEHSSEQPDQRGAILSGRRASAGSGRSRCQPRASISTARTPIGSSTTSTGTMTSNSPTCGVGGGHLPPTPTHVTAGARRGPCRLSDGHEKLWR